MDDYNILFINEAHEETFEDDEEIDFEVLHPDNPVMVRFQNALTQMLEKKITTLEEELIQTQGEIKKIKKEKKRVAEILYVQKAELDKLEHTLHQYNESIDNVLCQKEDLMPELERAREVHKKELEGLKEEEKLNIELQRTIDVQNHHLHQLREYEAKESSNWLILQQAIKKNEADKVAHLEKKTKQDYLLMRLENEIFRLELLIDDYKRQIDQKSQELTKQQQEVDFEEAELKALSEDNVRLQNVWKQITVQISKRDQEYSRLKVELEQNEIAYRQSLAELNSYKKSAEEEMFRNGSLVAEKMAEEQALAKLERQNRDLTETMKLSEHECSELEKMIESTEKTLKESLQTQIEYDRHLLECENKLKKLLFEKRALEEVFLSQIQNEMVTNGATAKLNDEICRMRDRALKEELAIKEIHEKFYSRTSFLERKTQFLNRNQGHLKKLNDTIAANEERMSNCRKELNQLDAEIRKQNGKLNEERRKLVAAQEQPRPCSVMEAKIIRMREDIEDLNKRIEEEKLNWTQKQNEIVIMTEERTKLFNKLNTLQEHLSILQEQNTKIDADIAKAKEDAVRHEKSISRLLNRISKLNGRLSDQKREGELLDNENYAIQGKIMEKLRITEDEVSALVNEIDELQEKKTSLEKELLDVQREELEWDKRIKLAVEMKKRIAEEQSESGDIGSMKNEIHRMEVRYAQLKKAQDKLMSNLETCVTKRERILDRVTTKESKKDLIKKKEKKLARHMDFLRNKIEKLKCKAADFEKEYNDLCNAKNELVAVITKYETEIESLENSIKNLDEKIEQNNLLKHKNLEILISKQRFSEFLSKYKRNKINATLPANELIVEKELMKQKSLQSDLIEILEDLCNEFPRYKNEIARITNILLCYSDAAQLE